MQYRSPLPYALSFFIFWIVVSGTTHLQHLAVGLLVAVGITYFNKDMLQHLHFARKKNLWLKTKVLFSAVVLFFKDLVVANIQVAMIVLSPKMPIDPVIIELQSGLHSELAKTLVANAITLTPGTLTIRVEGDVMTVHCLTKKNAIDVTNWPVLEKIKLLDKE